MDLQPPQVDANKSNHVEAEGKVDESRPNVKQRRDRGKWRNLYDECETMLISAALMYTTADIRLQCRKGKFEDISIAEPFMNLPSTSKELLPALVEQSNSREIFERIIRDAAMEQQNNSRGEGNEEGGEGGGKHPYLDLLMAKQKSIFTPSEQDLLESDDPKELSDGYVLLEVHDEKPWELVYGIGLNHILQRIDIVFRGSVTAVDFLVDADPLMAWFLNPVESVPGHPQEKKIGVQAGFAHYLHGSERSLGSGKSRDIIDRVVALQQQYAHYRLYVTGHSLGAALATLMAFELATAKEIQTPVSCIAVASPMVGNVGFLQAFQALEKKGHIRCARVVNWGDVIPLLPTRVCWCFDVFCCCCLCLFAPLQKIRYWHVGALILLRNNGTCEVSYKRDVLSYGEQLKNELTVRKTICRTIRRMICKGAFGRGDGDFLRNHSCKEYAERLEAVREELQGQHLQMIYFRQARSSINLVKPPEFKNPNLQSDSPVQQQHTRA